MYNGITRVVERMLEAYMKRIKMKKEWYRKKKGAARFTTPRFGCVPVLCRTTQVDAGESFCSGYSGAVSANHRVRDAGS